MRGDIILERQWVRGAFLFAASLLMFVLFYSSPLQPKEQYLEFAKSSIKSKIEAESPTISRIIEDVQRHEVILDFTRNAVSEIRLRQEAEERWLDYKFIFVGSLLGAFLARFAIGNGGRSDPDAQLTKIFSSSATCCVLAFATIVALIIDIHIRNSVTVINQLGSWIGYYAEPALLRREPDGFLPWETFLRDPYGFHKDPLYGFTFWPNLHLSTLFVYVIYLGVLQEVSLKGEPQGRSLLLGTFTLVQLTLLLFAWMAHTGPGMFESLPVPFVKHCLFVDRDHWCSANISGFFYVVPGLLNAACGFPYLWLLYRRSSLSAASPTAG